MIPKMGSCIYVSEMIHMEVKKAGRRYQRYFEDTERGA